MADLFEREILEDASSVFFQQQPLGVKSRLSSLKSALFQVFHQYYEDSEAREAHNSIALVSASILISRGVVLTQLLGLLVLTLTDRTLWSDFHWFMQALSFTRFDQLAASANCLQLFFFFTVGVVCFTCLSLVAMVACAYHSQPPNRLFLRPLFAWTMNYLRGAGLVPSVSVLLAGAKYSAVKAERMREYLDSTGEDMDLGSGGVVAGVAGLLGCLTVFLHITLVYEQFQSNSHWNLRAKAHAFADLIVHAAMFLIVGILFLSDLYVSVKLTCLAIAVPAAVASGLSLYYLPYYRLLQNLVWPSLFNIFILSAAALLLSDFQQRPGVAVAVILFVPPVIVKLTKEVMLMRWEFVCKHYTKNFVELESHYQVELGTRAMVQRVIDGDETGEKQVIEAFNISTGRFSAKMIYVWETNFYMSVMQDPQVAMIKITKAHLAASSLEADFRVFCFSKVLEKLHKRFEEMEYLTFWYVFQEAKAFDSESCHLLGSFWSELSSNMPRYPSLSRLVGQISLTLRKCIEKNKAALKTYKSSKQALNLLGTLLKDILNDRKGDEYISRAALVQDETENTFFSENGAVILVSGEYEKLGKILFVSDKAKVTLNIHTDNEILGHSIATLIPEPWKHTHSAYLKRFLLYSASSSVSHSILHLLTLSGFLIEVDAQIRVSYLHGNAFVIVAFAEREKVREIVMLGEGEKVLGHSQEIPSVSGLKDGLYVGVLIDTLLPGMSSTLRKIRAGDKFAYTNLRTRARHKFRLIDEEYSGQKVRVLYLLFDKGSQSMIQQVPSLSTIDPQTPITNKRVGFDSLSSLEEPLKSSTWADEVDPAFARKSRDEREVKVSITSSIASSQFLASSPCSQEDLKRVKNSSFRLKAALMCMVTDIQMCCMVVISGVCCGLVSVAADHEFLADDFQLVLRRGYYSARIATKVAQISRGRSDTGVETDIQLLDSVFITMKDSIANWHRGPALGYYTGNRVPTWDFWEGKATLHARNLFDAIQTYLDHAKSISKGVHPRTSDFLYIYRNGLGETFEVLNRTCHLHLETNLSELSNSQASVTAAIWFGQALMLLLYVALVLPSIALIAQVHSQAWRRLLSLNRGILLKLRNECHNRLEFHHNREDRIVRPFEPQTQEKRISSFRCKWAGLAVKTSAYILSSSLFLALLWRLLCTPVFDLLFVTPTVLAKLEDENMLLQTILFWVTATQAQERQWNGTDNAIKLTYPRLWFSPKRALAGDVSALKVNLVESLEGCLQWKTDFLVETEAGEEDVLKFGLHTAMSLITVDVKSESDLARLESDISATQTQLQQGIAKYVSDTEQLIAQRVLFVTFAAVAYSVFNLFLYVFLYIPMINSFRKQVSEVWKLYRIIPSADLVEATLKN